MGLRLYHGKPSQEAKGEIFNDFQTLKQTVLEATTVAITGVHFEHAIAILTDGPHFMMLTFAQMLGRVGCKRNRVVCCLIVDPSQGCQSNPHREEDLLGQEAWL